MGVCSPGKDTGLRELSDYGSQDLSPALIPTCLAFLQQHTELRFNVEQIVTAHLKLMLQSSQVDLTF